jgi:uncharacterized protein (DUF1697 family)
MQTYISILRGINVGGSKILKMDDLRALYEELGCRDVVTYIQSGNVVFRHDEVHPTELETRIKGKIKDTCQYDVPVIVLALNEMSRIIADNPFTKGTPKDITYLHVTFLSIQPEWDRYFTLKDGQYQGDEFSPGYKSIYLYCPNGYGKTKLTNSFFESKLKLQATTRNWRTANELLRIAEKLNSK